MLTLTKEANAWETTKYSNFPQNKVEEKKLTAASKMGTSVPTNPGGINKACDILGSCRSYGSHR